MSDEQENSPEANGPKPIRIGKRSLFTPSEAVAVEQHSVTPHVSRTRYGTARIEGRLSSPNARVPAVISQHCGGITVKGHTLKSFAYTTDAVIIRNTNANAILAVYPFTGEPVITQALLTVAQMPLFVGVGGGTTTGPRVAELAMVAEMQGAAGVVINAPAPAETIETTMLMVDIPESRKTMRPPNVRSLPARPSSMWRQAHAPLRLWQASACTIRKSRFSHQEAVPKNAFSPPSKQVRTPLHGRRQARSSCNRR